ncbi:hypothetical protein TNCV_4711191 [Trichonephila clavipes]|uniref:Uncharacterized protein n=1 Tax=Trichonephila clavipes TaxID=2585209 RepID=A0A8X6RRA9_TRICX|nr:hypothetical protein TNCV_4711191 [Trichonephila clavipes]
MQAPSHHIPDRLDRRGIWRSGWPRNCLISCKTVHRNTCGMMFGIIWLKKKARVLQKERYKTVLKMSSKYRYSEPLRTTKGIRIQKKLHPEQNSWLRSYRACNTESIIGTLP